MRDLPRCLHGGVTGRNTIDTFDSLGCIHSAIGVMLGSGSESVKVSVVVGG